VENRRIGRACSNFDRKAQVRVFVLKSIDVAMVESYARIGDADKNDVLCGYELRFSGSC
jgi:hypothetical protein